MTPIAHSSDSKKGIPEQSYRQHVIHVVKETLGRGRIMLSHWNASRGKKRNLLWILYLAALYHDLGKLAEGFQRFLKTNGRDKSGHIRHEDAGVVALLQRNEMEAALLASCHHRGLINFDFDFYGQIKTDNFRMLEAGTFTFSDTDLHLQKYLNNHHHHAGGRGTRIRVSSSIDDPLTRRLLLSCLVDADHTDTAKNYGQHSEMPPIHTSWKKRSGTLDNYISELEKKANAIVEPAMIARNKNRALFYQECDSSEAETMVTSEAPVGSGKTTAIMAHLLRVAEVRNARHIIVVLPFTNIIRQSVEVYREALVLPGENPEEVVAEHHHQVEFKDEGLRHLTTLWKAPVIVTTAVQFFETLAANNTGRLRKLHELPGSCIFVDEAHAAMPAHFLPLGWKWMMELQRNWNCHFVLASGSLAKFWELDHFKKIIEPLKSLAVSHLGSSKLKQTLSESERLRLSIRSVNDPLTYKTLIRKILSVEGPRIVVLNTVQAAAFLAKEMAKQGHRTVHLSTAIAPIHRTAIIEKIKAMLNTQSDWTLVATSLVEAGMNFSFRNGFRQRASACSLIQLGGRVNRNAEWNDSELWDFQLADDYAFHPGLAGSASTLGKLLVRDVFNPKTGWSLDRICKEALDMEFSQLSRDKAKGCFELEKSEQYADLAKEFRLISSDTRLVVIDPHLVSRLESFDKVTSIELIQNSIQLWHTRIQSLALPAIRGRETADELFRLPDNHEYDPDFLGYMAGVLKIEDSKITGGYFI